MADLTTRYLGLNLRNPLVASASPMTGKLDNLKRLEDAGAAAVVLPSLFEEQIQHEEDELARLDEMGTESFGEALDYLPPSVADFKTTTEAYLELVAEAKSALSIPVIASLNGTTTGGWLRFARAMATAGADALELNIYHVAADPFVSGADVERRYVDLVETVRRDIEIPLAVKVGPYFSSVGHVMRQLEDAGADGLVLFNRFLQPDIDLDQLAIQPHVEFSTSFESRLPLRWIALLRDELTVSLAATSGVQSADDALKLLLAGADAVMTTSALLRWGPQHLQRVLTDLEAWLDTHEYDSVGQLRGSMSRDKSGDPGAYERANYLKTLISYTGPYV